jgi:hypothetical protein
MKGVGHPAVILNGECRRMFEGEDVHIALMNGFIAVAPKYSAYIFLVRPWQWLRSNLE